jgi:hypothetical protein
MTDSDSHDGGSSSCCTNCVCECFVYFCCVYFCCVDLIDRVAFSSVQAMQKQHLLGTANAEAADA